jgi:lysophospholipase L1-like esterase
MEEKSIKSNLSKGKKIKFILFTLLFLLFIVIIISEAVLYFKHYQSTYDRMQSFSLSKAKWWTCDSVNGPRYVANQMNNEDAAFFKDELWYYNRLKIVNNEGYHDKDDFTEKQATNDSLKILIAGDSFTWGASADVDSSYVDVFERDIKNAFPAIVWNTGVPATGTNHAIFTTKKYLPLQKSNYVVLGFYVGNDFGDNLLPFNKLVFNNQASCYNLCDYDKDFKTFDITPSEAFKKATGSYPMEELNFFEKVLIRSRFITFVGELKDKIVQRLNGNKKRVVEQEYKMTKEYLNQLNQYTKQNNAELIVFVIPAEDDIETKQYHYTNATKVLTELGIKYVETVDLFGPKDYMKTGGGHWLNSGHIKAGHALSKYLVEYIKNKK